MSDNQSPSESQSRTKYQARFLPDSNGEPEWAILPYEAYQELLKAAQGGIEPAPMVHPVDTGVNIADALADPEELSPEQIQQLRSQKGLTAEIMAQEVGISPLYFAQIESGEREASPAILGAIHRAFQRL